MQKYLHLTQLSVVWREPDVHVRPAALAKLTVQRLKEAHAPITLLAPRRGLMY